MTFTWKTSKQKTTVMYSWCVVCHRVKSVWAAQKLVKKDTGHICIVSIKMIDGWQKKTDTVEPWVTNASRHKQISLQTNFPDKKCLGSRTVSLVIIKQIGNNMTMQEHWQVSVSYGASFALHASLVLFCLFVFNKLLNKAEWWKPEKDHDSNKERKKNNQNHNWAKERNPRQTWKWCLCLRSCYSVWYAKINKSQVESIGAKWRKRKETPEWQLSDIFKEKGLSSEQ